jgi:glycolate oxidase iron-sulfur subunit
MIDGLEFVELDEADWCCGLAGTQLITHYETSLKVLKRKTDNLAATRAGYVASGCPACQMQLNVGVRRAGLDMQVVHPIALLDRAYLSSTFPAKTAGRSIHPNQEITKVTTTNKKEKRWTSRSSPYSKK